jgi:hypothetical protein
MGMISKNFSKPEAQAASHSLVLLGHSNSVTDKFLGVERVKICFLHHILIAQ